MLLGSAVKKLREDRCPQYTAKTFAKKVGISNVYLSQLEHNRKKPNIEVLERIADLIGVTLPVLFWFSVEESDVPEAKRPYFKTLKGPVDAMIKEMF